MTVSLPCVFAEDMRGFAGVPINCSRDGACRNAIPVVLSLEDFRLSRDGAGRNVPDFGTGSLLVGLGMPDGLGLDSMVAVVCLFVSSNTKLWTI